MVGHIGSTVEYLIMKESDIMGVIEQTVARKEGRLNAVTSNITENQKWLLKT